MAAKGWAHPAHVVSVHDGDTCLLSVDLDFGVWWMGNCRVYGINAPELATTEGKAAAAYAKQILIPGVAVTVVNFGWDKYGGRFDGQIILPNGDDFAQLMLDAGYAVPFNGG